MKATIEVDCTPEEARRFLGLPDVSKANEAYTEAFTKAMKGAGSLEQLQDVAKGLAPMGLMGMKMFQQMFESGVAMAGAGKKKRED
ncbi:MAG: DUF6489 family protein [Novosphingobium sp.]